MKKNNQSLIEETANSITHGIALLLSIAGAVILIVSASRYGDIWRVACFSVYGSTLIILYASSALYHSFSLSRQKHVLKIIDHSAVYLFIAGSYTPFVLIPLRGELGWTLFGIIWALALAGVIFNIFFLDRFLVLPTITYLAMGWLALIAVRPIINNFPFKGIVWLIAGGLLYTSGIIFYFSNKLPFHHAIWHLFVLGGSICHYFAILFYVLPV
ncbi:MAG: hemolysin III family protein [Candidatus Omnitrophota bacterium]